MSTWTGGKPKNIQELFKFYFEYVKPLYSSVQTQNKLPTEVLFEIDAAFDHIAQHWITGESEESVSVEAFGHLKRSCLDIFKLKVREARNLYDTLCRIDISVINNGEFEKNLHRLFNEIRQKSTEARCAESDKNDKTIPAFEKWEVVYARCIELENDYFHNPRLNWAKKKGLIQFLRQQFWGLLIGVAASLLASIVWSSWPQINKTVTNLFFSR